MAQVPRRKNANGRWACRHRPHPPSLPPARSPADRQRRRGAERGRSRLTARTPAGWPWRVAAPGPQSEVDRRRATRRRTQSRSRCPPCSRSRARSNRTMDVQRPGWRTRSGGDAPGGGPGGTPMGTFVTRKQDRNSPRQEAEAMAGAPIHIDCKYCGLRPKVPDRDGADATVCDDCYPRHRGQRLRPAVAAPARHGNSLVTRTSPAAWWPHAVPDASTLDGTKRPAQR